MPTYRVLWDEDIEADSHVEAARKAVALMAKPTPTTHIFVVEGPMGDNRCIDLTDHADEVVSPPLITPHKHRFSGDDDTCNVYHECPVTWGEYKHHRDTHPEESIS